MQANEDAGDLPIRTLRTTGSYEGFDVDPDLVARCRENTASRHGNFHFEHANVARYRSVITFFILNDESRRLERTPQSTFRFGYPYWRVGAIMKLLLRPEAAVAYPDGTVRETLRRNRLEVQQVLFGNWCGRRHTFSF